MRYIIVGPGLLFVGMAVSTVVIHQLRRLHMKHQRAMEALGQPK